MAIVHNKPTHRKTSDPVFRRLYLLARIEGAKAKLLKAIEKLPSDATEKDMDALIRAHFASKNALKQ